MSVEALDTSKTAELLPLSKLSIEQLEVAASEVLAQANSAMGAALMHYIRWGEILNELRARHGNMKTWEAWLDNQGIGRAWAGKCMRVAHYKDHLPNDAFKPVPGPRGGLREPGLNTVWRLYVKGAPPISPYGRVTFSRAHIQEARRLHSEGLTILAISELMACGKETVAGWIDPALAERREAQRTSRRKATIAARKALEEKQHREERDQLARQQGGDISVTYSLIRRALVSADRAQCSDAVGLLHRAEEAVVTQMRAQRQS